MANSAKSKGDRAELEAVEILIDLAGDLAIENPRRLLGAGRRADEGDLRVFPDVAIQAKAWKTPTIGRAIRVAAIESVQQAANNDDQTFALGLVKIDGARKGSVRWLASSISWPMPLLDDPVEFSLVGKLLKWVRDDLGPYGYKTLERTDRIARFHNPSTPTDPAVLVAPIEAWLHAYRTALTSPIEPGWK